MLIKIIYNTKIFKYNEYIIVYSQNIKYKSYKLNS